MDGLTNLNLIFKAFPLCLLVMSKSKMIIEYCEDVEEKVLRSTNESKSDEIAVIIVQDDYQYMKAVEISNKHAGNFIIVKEICSIFNRRSI